MNKPYLALAALLAFSGYTLWTMSIAEQSLLQFGLQLARDTVFGHQARRHALQHAPHIDGIGQFVGAEGLDAKTPGRQALQQTFLGQFFKGQPDRRARHAQVCRHIQLDQPLAWRIQGRADPAAKFIGDVVDLGDHAASVAPRFACKFYLYWIFYRI